MQSPTQDSAPTQDSTPFQDAAPTQEAGSSDNMLSEARSDAERLSNSASKRIHSELDSRKGTAAQQAKSVSSAIDRAAGELDDSAPQWVKSAFRQGAQQIQRFADQLEQKDSRQILADVRTMARDNPGTFLAACTALGFAAARVFKAGAEESSANQPPQRQFPPTQADEPMLRQSGAGSSPSTSRAGEFA